eukprot:g2619.t1
MRQTKLRAAPVTREQLVEFYERHEPAKLANVDNILAHFGHDPSLVHSNLMQKYGETVVVRGAQGKPVQEPRASFIDLAIVPRPRRRQKDESDAASEAALDADTAGWGAFQLCDGHIVLDDAAQLRQLLRAALRAGLMQPVELRTIAAEAEAETETEAASDTQRALTGTKAQALDAALPAWVDNAADAAGVALFSQPAPPHSEQDAMYARANRALMRSTQQVLTLIRDKITQHTRSDQDRLRKIFNIFNDGRDEGVGSEEESGIDKAEFSRGLERHFSIVLSPEQAADVFDALDEDGSGTIQPKELAHALFPSGVLKAPWYVRSEEGSRRKYEQMGAAQRQPESCAAPPSSRAAPEQVLNLIRDKITQHTRSDQDRLRKIFNIFNDGRDEGAAEGAEMGIDMAEFRKGLTLHFGITLTDDQARSIFGLLDEDGSGVVVPTELAHCLFPRSQSSVRL